MAECKAGTVCLIRRDKEEKGKGGRRREGDRQGAVHASFEDRRNNSATLSKHCQGLETQTVKGGLLLATLAPLAPHSHMSYGNTLSLTYWSPWCELRMNPPNHVLQSCNDYPLYVKVKHSVIHDTLPVILP